MIIVEIWEKGLKWTISEAIETKRNRRSALIGNPAWILSRECPLAIVT